MSPPPALVPVCLSFPISAQTEVGVGPAKLSIKSEPSPNRPCLATPVSYDVSPVTLVQNVTQLHEVRLSRPPRKDRSGVPRKPFVGSGYWKPRKQFEITLDLSKSKGSTRPSRNPSRSVFNASFRLEQDLSCTTPFGR